MQFLTSLFAWANVPFTVSLSVALIFALLQVSGLLGLLIGGGDHDADADADADADVDADADADADADHDVDADGDADNDADHDHDHDQDHDSDQDEAGGKGLLVGLGVGKVPFSIVWQTYAATFGFTGIAANTLLLARTGALPAYALLWATPLALAAGYGMTRAVSGALGRVVADPKQNATSRKELVGRTGVVISSRVTDAFGEVRVQDKTGHVVRIICRTRESEKPIAEGREVVLVEYDRERDWLYAAPLDGEDEAEDEAAEAEARARRAS